MVFNASFNNISAISWRLVLLVEETGVPGETHQPVTNCTGGNPTTIRSRPQQPLYHHLRQKKCSFINTH
jgi:hypothetical protein